MTLRLSLVLLFTCAGHAVQAQDVVPLEGTLPLTGEADYSDRMLSGFERYLLRETQQTADRRRSHWQRDFSSHEAYEQSISANRARLAKMIGVVDSRLPLHELQFISGTATPAVIAATDRYTVHAVRWPVLEGVEGDGLLLMPRDGPPKARVVCLPDADQTPEMLCGLAPGIPAEQQFARKLAEQGLLVIVPTLIDRSDTWSGNPNVWMTNQPHREWVYRPAFELGRHLIGYEVQKVLAAVDWMAAQQPATNIGVAGYGEGGLLALYSAALDVRIDSALVSGYFDAREQLWQEPIYRNVFGLLTEFGDAEIASLIVPRRLTIEHSAAPQVTGPPAAAGGRRDVAAPGRVVTAEFSVLQSELERLKAMFPANKTELTQDAISASAALIAGPQGDVIGPGSPDALRSFTQPLLDQPWKDEQDLALASDLRHDFDPRHRQQRQVQQLVDHTQLLLRRSSAARESFWKPLDPSRIAADDWAEACRKHREYFHEEIIGRIPPATGPVTAHTRQTLEREKWIAYEVVVDVDPEVIVWGFLLVPKGIPAGERRPVVVCQHGLEGLPTEVFNEDPSSQGFAYYKAFAARLAEQGMVTFAPHHYYRGGNRFRQLQRQAYPLKKTLFAFTVAQHERLLDWLEQLPFVDAERIAFYGLSYGGFSAMRLPPLVERYALSINSAEFNDMAYKKASVHDRYSYPFYQTYEVFEFNLANTFGYSDLAALIAPRPFMVERGHRDGVAPDEWVAAEYAKIRRLYTTLGISDRTEIEFFDGPHTIHAQGTFRFLERHLRVQD